MPRITANERQVNNALTPEKKGQSVLKSVISTAAMFIAFPMAMKAISGAAFRANLGIGRKLVSMSSKGGFLNKLTHRLARGNAGARTFGRKTHRFIKGVQAAAAGSATKGSGFSLGDLTKARGKLAERRMFMDGITKAGNVDLRATTLLSNSGKFKNNPLASYVMARGKAIQTMGDKALKGPGMFASRTQWGRNVSAGNMIKIRASRYLKDAASYMPTSYALSTLMGHTKQHGSWYSPATMAKYATTMLPFDIGFRALGPVMKGVGRVGSKFIPKRANVSRSNDMVAKALNFGEKVSNLAGRVGGAFNQAITANQQANLRFKELGGTRGLTRMVNDFGNTVLQFASNVGRRTGLSNTILSKRKRAFDQQGMTLVKDIVQGGGHDTIGRTRAGQIAMRKKFGQDIAKNSFLIKVLNASSNMHKITGGKERIKSIKGLSKEQFESGFGARGFGYYKGRGSLSYRGREYDLSNIAPTNMIENAMSFVNNHFTSVSNLLGIPRRIAMKNQAAIHKFGEEEEIQTYFRPKFGNIFDMYKKGSVKSKEWAKQSNNDAGLGRFFKNRVIRKRPDLKTADIENMWWESLNFRSTGNLRLQKGESALLIGGKMHLGQRLKSGHMQWNRVGKYKGKYLSFNSIDKESIGGWRNVGNNIIHSHNQALNKTLDPNTPEGVLEKLNTEFVDRARPGKGLKGFLNQRGAEIGGKQQVPLPTKIWNWFFRTQDTTNARTFVDPKSDGLYKVMNTRKLSTSARSGKNVGQMNKDTIAYIQKTLDFKMANDVKLAQSFGSDFATHLQTMQTIDNSATGGIRQAARYLINPFESDTNTAREAVRGLEKAVTRRGSSVNLPAEMRKVISRIKYADDEHFAALTKPSYHTTSHEASVVDMYNLMVMKTSLTGGTLNVKDPMALQSKIAGFAKDVTLTKQQQQFLKGVNMSTAFDNISTHWSTTGLVEGTEGLTHNLQTALNYLSKSDTLYKKQGMSPTDQLKQLQHLSTKVTDVLSFREKGQVYYKEVLADIAKAKEPIFGFGEKNLSVFRNRRPAPDHIFIPDVKASKGRIQVGLGKMLRNTSEDIVTDQNPFIITSSQLSMSSAMNAVNNVANMVGLGFNPESTPDVYTFGRKMLTKRILPAMAMYKGYQAADAFVDDSKLFDGTALGEGIGVFAASFGAKARIASQAALDVTGVSALSRKMEDLMPGSVKSPLSGAVRGFGAPLGGAALGFKMGGVHGGFVGGAIGGAVSILTAGGPAAAFGYWDITKSRSEVIDEYLGKKDVAVRKGRGWELSSEMLSGGGPKYYTKNWFATMRAGAKETPVLYDGKMEKFYSFLDRQHYEEKHYYSRPYPVSSGMGEHALFIGKTAQVGSERMHEEDLGYLNDPFYGAGPGSFNPSPLAGGSINLQMSPQESSASMLGSSYGSSSQSTFGLSGGQVRGLNNVEAMAPSDMRARTRYAFQSAQEMAGLRGWFSADIAYKGLTGKYAPYEDVPMLQSAGDMTSPVRSFWDLNAGNVMLMGEFGRRVVGKEPGWVEKVNPFRNMMPDWLPDNLKYGDPYTAVELGEQRLPGQGYTAANDINYTFPGDAQLLGKSQEDIFKYYTGQDFPVTEDDKWGHFGRPTAGHFADLVAGQNFNAKRNAHFFDAKTNMSATSDLVLDQNGMKAALNVKTVSADTFDKLYEARAQDASEMNGTMTVGRLNAGSVVYVDPQGRTKSFDVKKDFGRYREDIVRMKGVQDLLTSEVMNNGLQGNFSMGRAYSRTDRLKVLANVAPYSDEYFRSLNEVKAQEGMGALTPNMLEKRHTAIEQRHNIVTPEFHKNRFYRAGTAITPDEVQRQAQIKSQYGPLQRGIGAGWEYMMQLQTPVHTKLWSNRTAIDEYEKTQVYGKSFRAWERPVDDFLKPAYHNMRRHTDPLQGSLSFAMGGFLLGGPAGAALGAGFGAVHAPFLSNGNIPNDVQRARDINWNLDQAKYRRATQLYEQTNDPIYMKERNKTLTHVINEGGSAKMADLMSAIPKQERRFIASFMDSGTVEERERIMATVPEYIKPILQRKWTETAQEMPDTLPQDVLESQDLGEDLWNPNLNMDDLKLRMYQNEAIDARQGGVGFYAQQHRVRREQEAGPAPAAHGNYANAISVENIISNLIPGSITSTGSDEDGVVNVIIEVME